jgi:hypothetical protein
MIIIIGRRDPVNKIPIGIIIRVFGPTNDDTF